MDANFAPQNSSLTLRKTYSQTNCLWAGARVKGLGIRGIPWHESLETFNT